jgi:hypothetical protein
MNFRSTSQLYISPIRSPVYPPISAVDGAFVFDDSEHLYNYFSSDASDPLKEGFYEALNVTILWLGNGGRQFTANVPIERRRTSWASGCVSTDASIPAQRRSNGGGPVEVAYEALSRLRNGGRSGNPLATSRQSTCPECRYVSLSSCQLAQRGDHRPHLG